MEENLEKPTRKQLSGVPGFLVIALGQMVSILASSMSGFALTIYVFDETASATALGIMTTAYLVPFLVFSPLAGAMVDRYNRKLMMVISDMVAGLGTLAILILYSTGALEIWHFYVVNLFLGLGNAFQWPAYSAVITTIVPKDQLSRANGIMSLVNSGPGIVAPVLAGALLPSVGLSGILLFDAVTFVLAVVAVAIVQVPQPERTVEGEEGKGSILKEAGYGFKYIFARPSLMYLQIILFLSNIFIGFRNTLLAPMVLSRTGNNSIIFGSVQSAGAVALVLGGLLMSTWKGFNKRVYGLLLGWGSFMVFGVLLTGLGRSLAVWAPASILAGIGAMVGSASANALWQSKVAPDVQGRVFSARRLIAWIPDPIMPIVAGTMADYWAEPAMQTAGHPLAEAFGWMVGTGPGAGMSLLTVVFGLGGILALGAGFFIPAVRDVQEILPDHDEIEKAEEQQEEE